jgi:hypothetical protein
MKKIFLSLLITFLFTNSYASPYKWESKENRVTISQKIDINDKYLAQVFILDYTLNSQCAAFASIISIANSKTLGKRTKEDIYKSNKKGNQLNFYVDDKEVKYQQEKIIKVEYENGVEFGTLAPISLITSLEKSNGKFHVHLGETKLLRIPASVGFSVENKKAYEFCLKNKR